MNPVKLTLHENDAVKVETPTEQVLTKGGEIVKVVDARNRSISLKKPGVLAQYRIIEVCGDSAGNETYMGMVLPLIFICDIDGEAITQPKNKIQLEALISRLDEDGIDAVMNGVKANWGKPDPDADKAAVKK